jgi:hypothetical protein
MRGPPGGVPELGQFILTPGANVLQFVCGMEMPYSELV